jgi:thiamine kinase-like enzyme
MNELKPVQDEVLHKMSDELKMQKLQNIVENKMPKWFDLATVKYMSDLVDVVQNFEYTTRKAWSHCDLNSGNVLYDAANSKMYVIDFAEANYNFIFRDIFSPLAVDLEICKPVYEEYFKLHNQDKYRMYGPRNPETQNIMRYRMITVLLKRFTKAGDDLRMNPQSEKTVQNNIEKVQFMKELTARIQNIEKQLVK